METALPCLLKQLPLHALLKLVMMQETNPLTLDVNPFPTNVLPMVLDVYCLEAVKPLQQQFLVQELVHVIQDRNA